MNITGHLLFHSETGTEGGYYALQDDAWTHGREVDVCPWGSDRHCPAFQAFWTADQTPRHADYRGLVLLKNGDDLVISQEDGTPMWRGTVNLREVDSYGPEGGTPVGFRVHHKPEMLGVDERTWERLFHLEKPAVLRRAEPDA